MKRIAIITLLAAVVGAGIWIIQGRGPAQAAVVELYTSENCVNCPAAEADFHEIVGGGAIGLALHVDYKTLPTRRDPYALEEALERQNAYAETAGQDVLFTPQFVVNGIPMPPGADGAAVHDAMNRGPVTSIEVEAVRSGDEIWVSWPKGQDGEDAWVFITEDGVANSSMYRDRERVKPHQRIVRAMESVDLRTGEATFSYDDAWSSDNLRAVFVVHDGDAISGAGLARVLIP